MCSGSSVTPISLLMEVHEGGRIVLFQRNLADELRETSRGKGASRRCHVSRRHRLDWVPPREFRDPDVLCKSKFFQQPNPVIIGVELIPSKTMPCRNRIGVVTVMPTFAPSKQCHPPAISRLVPGCEATPTMEMGR
jgi:hypothetical protein